MTRACPWSRAHSQSSAGLSRPGEFRRVPRQPSRRSRGDEKTCATLASSTDERYSLPNSRSSVRFMCETSLGCVQMLPKVAESERISVALVGYNGPRARGCSMHPILQRYLSGRGPFSMQVRKRYSLPAIVLRKKPVRRPTNGTVASNRAGTVDGTPAYRRGSGEAEGHCVVVRRRDFWGNLLPVAPVGPSPR